jgi:GT2 family glycosyltransferase
VTEAGPKPITARSAAVERRLDVIVVHYETPDLLDECLRSIPSERESTIREVIVVDNSASPDAAERVVHKHPAVRLLRPATNVGYGAGANHGMAATDGDYALVLNADARVQPGAVQALVDDLDRHPEAGVVGPRLVDEGGGTQPSCARFPTPGRVLLHESGLWKIARRTKFLDGVHPFFDLAVPGEVPWVLGAALAIRRREFDAVGGFDPHYFMYYEEVDLCRRLMSRGTTTRFTPAATVAHVGGASTARNQVRMQREMFRSLARYLRTHGTAPRLVRLRIVVAAVAVAHFTRDLIRRPKERGGESSRPGSGSWLAVLGDAVKGWPDD